MSMIFFFVHVACRNLHILLEGPKHSKKLTKSLFLVSKYHNFLF